MVILGRKYFFTWRALKGAFTALCLSLLLTANARADLKLESQVKGAFLERFLAFIEKDGATHVLAEQSQRVEICVYADHAIFSALQELSQVSENKIAYHFVNDLQDSSTCLLMFIGSESNDGIQEILDKISGSQIVTVSDVKGFADKGGMIELVKEGRHIRFILNRHAAKNHGIKFGAQLLSLAKEVIER